MASSGDHGEDVEYYTEEEVVEEIEEEIEEDVGIEARSETASSAAKVEATPSPKPRGKVVPSPAVASMKMRSPGDNKPSPSKPSGSPLSPSKNPFTTFGGWDAKTMSEIQIRFPDLTNKCESTNELTRNNKPEARYWKDAITFKYESFSSDTIRFNNVQIPCMQGVRNYGTGFVYICLPGEISSIFAQAGKLKRPTTVSENRLVPDSKRWWKSVNGVEGTFGQIDARTKNFVPKPLDAIFEATSKGVTANVVLKFICKASTDNKEQLKPTTMCNVAVEIVRGYLVDVDVDVEPPVRIAKPKKKIEPLAVASDVATDSLSKRMAELGI